MRNLKLLSILSFIILLGAISTSTAQIRGGGKQFTPADFDPQKHILLVADMPRLNKPDERHSGATSKLDKALKELYPYKYEIISLKDLEDSTKYADTAVYRFVLINTLNSYTHSTTTTISSGTRSHSVSPSATSTSIDFAFYDRSTDKRYPNSGWHSSIIKMTMKKVVGIIKKEKGLK